MRQVPRAKIGIVGDGRVARHIDYYLASSGFSVSRWSRKKNLLAEIEKTFAQCEIVLFLISDSNIQTFIREHAWNPKQRLVHFSGALVIDEAVGLHPLMTFGTELYDLPVYEKISFIGEKGRTTFRELFPELKNPSFEIEKSEKPFYHALCVMSGNFTTILWQKFFSELETRFCIPPQAALPYLAQVAKNLTTHWQQALTGPLARRDLGTIEKNLCALKSDSFQPIYNAFVKNQLGQKNLEEFSE